MTITGGAELLQREIEARAEGPRRDRPVLIGIVGDSAAGKTTLTNGVVRIFGAERVTAVCTDDYHRFDREQRREMSITPLHPDCNYIGIMEQHLRLLAAGEPILKPIYDHSDGSLKAPKLIEPRDIVVVEGLLAYHTKAMRDSFDVKVYLDPPEDLRRRWKVTRDCSKRGYRPEEVIADLARREPDSAKFIRPQREHADIVVRFHPPGPSVDVDPARLGVRLVLRPTLAHPYLLEIPERTRIGTYRPIRVELARDYGRPVDVLEVEGGIGDDAAAVVEETVWRATSLDGSGLDLGAVGLFADGQTMRRSHSLALTQLLLVVQLMGARVRS